MSGRVELEARHDEPGDTVVPEVVDEVLDPRVVGIASGRCAKAPTHVVGEQGP